MWAAIGAANWTVAAPMVVALLSLLGALATAWFSFRGSSRSTDAQREAAFDARVDKRLADAEAREAALTAEVRTLREQVVRLRLAVIQLGGDPDAALTAAARDWKPPHDG